MSKRGAATELNADNWDNEDEQEEAGEFKQADAKKMAQRQVLKAKRRIDSSQAGGTKAFAAFQGFAGFGSKSAEGTRTTSISSSLFNGTSAQTSSTSSTSIFGGAMSVGAASFSFGPQKPASSGSTQSDVGASKSSDTSTPSKPQSNGHSSSKSQSRSKYLQQLKALNESVSKWIKNHVESNPYCILTPIFKDYEKHLEDINKKFPEVSQESGSESGEKKEKETELQSTPMEEVKEAAKPSSALSGFSFVSTTSAPASSAPSFALGSSSKPDAAPAPSFPSFSFGSIPSTSSGGFNFAVNKPSTDVTSQATEEEEYVPPKPEVTQVSEEDAIYSKKCKLFYQKDGCWKDKGIGNLHLKPCDGKTQLLIRADTNLGNILLNIMLNSSIPMSRQGKNNVLMVCVPNPPLEDKKDGEAESKTSVSMLIRVKTAQDADELLEKLTEGKVAKK